MLVTPRALQTPSPPTHMIKRAGGSVSIEAGGGVLLDPLAGQPITLDEFLIQNGKAQPAVSAAGTGRLNFNSTTNKWEVSEHAGAWMNLMGSSSGNAPVDAQYVTLIANTTLTAERLLTGTANQITITDNGAGSTVVLSTPQNLHSAATPTFASLTLSGLTANSFLFSGTGGLLTSTAAPTNGQLLIGSTGAAPVLASLTGTANQITVTGGAGSVTLATPQDLHTSATPQFTRLGLGAAAGATTELTITQPVRTTGSPTGVLFTGGAHTTLAASTEAIDINFNLARTVQFSTGALATQRAMLIQAPTYAFVAASTITDAATVAISGAPIQGTNATITNPYALWVQAGNSKMPGIAFASTGRITLTPTVDSADGFILSAVKVLNNTGNGAAGLWGSNALDIFDSSGNGNIRIGITNGGISFSVRTVFATSIATSTTSATPTAGSLTAQDGAGTNINGAATLSFIASLGTGAGTQGVLGFKAATNRLATGSTLQSAATLFQVGEVQATHPAVRGAFTSWPAQTWTDDFTLASATAAAWVAHSIQTPTIAANALTVTTSDAASFYVANRPTAGTNMTVTRGWSAWFDAGDIRIDDNIQMMSGTAFFGTFDHAITANRTWTFQDSTDTIVGRDTTDTLTNKTLGATTLSGTLSRAADQIIDLTGAATRTLTLQNSTSSQVADFDIDGSYFFRNNTSFTMKLTGTPTAARIFTLPDVADDTVAVLAATQTFSGAKTFTGGLTVTTANVTITDRDVVLSATTGTKIGTATTQKLGFYNSTPIIQGAAVADASGGATIDAEARTAINTLLARIRSLGLIAT